MIRRGAFVVLVVAAATLGFSGPAVVGAPTARAPAAAGGTAGAAFPVLVHSGDGTVRIPSRPTRILCLSPSATQMLYALGAGKQVVGVDKYSAYPAGAPRTKLSGAETNAEDYLPWQPDLVILSYPTGKIVQQLQVLHIPALVLPAATTFADVDSQLRELAVATGHSPAVVAVDARLHADLSAAVREANGAGRGRTYYIEVDPTYYTATSKTFIGAEFSLFGMKNVADAAGRSTPYPQISPEYLLKQSPDYVFLADSVCCHQNAATFARRPGFGALPAVRHHDVVTVNDTVASQWGPYTIEDFVSNLARALHP